MKSTALSSTHKNLNAKMVEYAGFEMPVQYSGVIQEHNAVRNSVGIFDVSHMGQFLFKGNAAFELLQHITTNDVAKLEVGKAQYSCLTNDFGGIVDDLILYQIKDEEYLMVVNAANIEKDWNWIQQHNAQQVSIENQSDQISLLAVQGPKALQVVQKLTATPLESIPYYHFQMGEIAQVPNVLISATGYTGSGGFELYFPNEFAETLWNAIMDAGKEWDIMPCGLAARDTLRLEKGFCLYGNDINDQTTPLEAGLGWITKFGTGFIAEPILLEQKEKGIPQKLMGFVMKERAIPRHGYPIVDAKGQAIGEVTSGTQSPSLQQGIGLGYIKSEFAKIGETIFIEIRDKKIPAEVVKIPFV